MKIIMAVSQDGFVARGPADDMRWTGKMDKQLFRLLTSSGQGIVGVGSTTLALMPDLPGRRLKHITRSPSRDQYKSPRPRAEQMTLEGFQLRYPDEWLAGGITVARAALDKGLVSALFLTRIPGVFLGEGVPLGLDLQGDFNLAYSSQFDTVMLQKWVPVGA